MITTATILPMIDDWLSTRPNAYFGSSYGADLQSFLLKPLSAPVADQFLAKMKLDIPVLAGLSDDQLSIQTEDVGFEKKIVHLVLGEISINLNKVADQQQQAVGDTFDVDAG